MHFWQLQDENQRPIMRDIMDAQLVSREGNKIGRVADIEAEWREDGCLLLTHLVTGPQALICRFDPRLRGFARFLFRDRFEHHIPFSEVKKIDPRMVHLRGNADEYEVGQSDRWIAKYIFRWIPGGKS